MIMMSEHDDYDIFEREIVYLASYQYWQVIREYLYCPTGFPQPVVLSPERETAVRQRLNVVRPYHVFRPLVQNQSLCFVQSP